MAASFVQGAGITTFTTVSSGAVAFVSNVTAGSAIAVFARVTSKSRTLSAADDNGNSYSTSIGPFDATDASVRMYAFRDMTVNAGATTVTVSVGGGTGTMNVAIAEVAGQDTGATPTTATTDKTGSNSVQTGAAQTPSVNGVMLAFWANGSSGYVFSSNGSGWAEWTTRAINTPAGWAGFPTSGGVVTSGNTYTPLFNTTGNETGGMISVVIAEAAVATLVAKAYQVNQAVNRASRY